jgi:aminoglycoside 6'-N-acetyltransferase
MTAPTLHGERVTLRPPAADDLDALSAATAEPGVAEWFGEPMTPEDLANNGAAWAVEVGGALAGWLAFSEEEDPEYRHAGLDIFLTARFQDRGLGREALRLAIAWLTGPRAHHRLTIDPAAANARAIATYAAVGFRPVGVMRLYERGADGWHDGLLMDLLAGEAT